MPKLRMRLLCLPAAAVLAAAAHAQDPQPEVVLPPENVRYDYAQVLNVEPIYQTLRTTSNERVCEQAGAEGGSRLVRVVSAVRNRLTGNTTVEEHKAGLSNCRMMPVAKEFKRAIAYDVDYVYKGSKFRTRLAQDPGNRLRIRVTITPQPNP